MNGNVGKKPARPQGSGIRRSMPAGAIGLPDPGIPEHRHNAFEQGVQLSVGCREMPG